MLKGIYCMNRCIAMIVWNESYLLLIERKKYPYGFALPGGHLEENENYKDAGRRELKEETGLNAVKLKYILEDVIYDNGRVCSKGSDEPHICKVYRAFYEGSLKLNKKETKSIGWYSMLELYDLALKTNNYLDKLITEKEWENSPGVVPVCYKWFVELGILGSGYNFYKKRKIFI